MDTKEYLLKRVNEIIQNGKRNYAFNLYTRPQLEQLAVEISRLKIRGG